MVKGRRRGCSAAEATEGCAARKGLRFVLLIFCSPTRPPLIDIGRGWRGGANEAFPGQHENLLMGLELWEKSFNAVGWFIPPYVQTGFSVGLQHR
jgi:hypothetical protein